MCRSRSSVHGQVCIGQVCIVIPLHSQLALRSQISELAPALAAWIVKDLARHTCPMLHVPSCDAASKMGCSHGTHVGPCAALTVIPGHAGLPVLVRLLTTCIGRMESSTAQPPQPPSDWVIPGAVSCHCPDCRQLQAFLASPTQQVAEFRRAQRERGHIHRCTHSCSSFPLMHALLVWRGRHHGACSV